MDKNQYSLCIEVLHRLHDAGVLPKIVLIGSWCLPFYREHYFKAASGPALRTRDIDLLVSRQTVFPTCIDLPLLLEDLGFILDHSYPDGHSRLFHPELIVEFLVPEVGRGSAKPYPIPALSMTAQRLRFLEILERDTISIASGGTTVTIPHPVSFGLHKLVVAPRRRSTEKRRRDITSGLEILDLALEHGDADKLRKVFDRLSKKQQKGVLSQLREQTATDILDTLND